MAITQLNSEQSQYLPPLTDTDIEKMVQTTVGSLKCDSRCFEHSKIAYNSDFFKGEAAEFRQALCKALHTFFEPVGTFQFWKKHAGI